VPEVIERLGNRSGNTLDWSTDPLVVTLGTTAILEGLERALPGCREADSVQVYMTSNLAYGKQLVGVVPKNSMVAWYMKILKVVK
jgi:FKBP-type peptidyl-prolyl cis-trans isomerase